MQGEDLPQATNRIDLDAGVRDVWGLPAGRVTYSTARARRRVRAPLGAAARSGVAGRGRARARRGSRRRVRRARSRPHLEPMSKHWMGTARMGDDAATSVCDPWQRLWDVDNVVVTDSSVFPTSTGYGPTLTLVALAVRGRPRTGGIDVTEAFADVDALFAALDASRHADDEGGLSILEHSLQCAELLQASHPRRRRAAGRRPGARPRVARAHAGGLDAAARRRARRRRLRARARARSVTAWPTWSAGTSRPSATSLATDPDYAALLSARSEVTLGFQGGVMDARRGRASSSAVPIRDDLVALRRADDAAKVRGKVVRPASTPGAPPSNRSPSALTLSALDPWVRCGHGSSECPVAWGRSRSSRAATVGAQSAAVTRTRRHRRRERCHHGVAAGHHRDLGAGARAAVRAALDARLLEPEGPPGRRPRQAALERRGRSGGTGRCPRCRRLREATPAPSCAPVPQMTVALPSGSANRSRPRRRELRAQVDRAAGRRAVSWSWSDTMIHTVSPQSRSARGSAARSASVSR